MRIATVLLSFNSPDLTERAYAELVRCAGHTLIVLDNSTDASLIAATEHTRHMGFENVGHGGMIDHVLTEAEFRDYDFVGILNNDTFGYPNNFIDVLSSYMGGDVGIVSPSIKRGGSWWRSMWHKGNTKWREQNFIETIAPYYNVRLLAQLAAFCPVEYFGMVDRSFSLFSVKCGGFRNILVDEIVIGHELGGARRAGGTARHCEHHWRESVHDWASRHPELKNYHTLTDEELNRL